MFFEPLQIKFELSTPIAIAYRKQPHPIHLDALIIALMTNGKVAQVPTTGTSWEDDPYAPGTGIVPLQVHQGESPVYCASIGFPKHITWGKTGIVKKPPEHYMQKHISSFKRSKSFRPSGESSGKYRAWSETMDIASVDSLIFECIGDGEVIDDLLRQQLRRIGFLRRAGYGNVHNFEVTESDNPNAGLLTPDGLPARNLPAVDWGEQPGWHNMVYAATKAPYWYPGNKEICWSPVLPL